MGTTPLWQMETSTGSQATAEWYPMNLQRADLAAGRVTELSGRTLAKRVRKGNEERQMERGSGLSALPRWKQGGEEQYA